MTTLKPNIVSFILKKKKYFLYTSSKKFDRNREQKITLCQTNNSQSYKVNLAETSFLPIPDEEY